MLVDIKKGNTISFELLDEGEVFYYGSFAYMKTEETEEGNNTVCLSTGALSATEPRLQVYRVSGKFVGEKC